MALEELDRRGPTSGILENSWKNATTLKIEFEKQVQGTKMNLLTYM